MEIKNNESTDLRPEGARLLDAPLVSMDISQFIQQLKAKPTWQTSDRNAMTVYKPNGMCNVLIALHKAAVMNKHTADGIISVQVLGGEITFSTDGQSEVIRKNQMIALHKGLPP